MPASVGSSHADSVESLTSFRSTILTGALAPVYGAVFQTFYYIRGTPPLVPRAALQAAKIAQLAVLGTGYASESVGSEIVTFAPPTMSYGEASLALYIVGTFICLIAAVLWRSAAKAMQEQTTSRPVLVLLGLFLRLLEVAYVPLLALAMRFLNCDYGSQRLVAFDDTMCWSNDNVVSGVLSIFVLVALITMRVLAAALVFPMTYKEQSLVSAPVSRVFVAEAALQTVFAVVLPLLGQGNVARDAAYALAGSLSIIYATAVAVFVPHTHVPVSALHAGAMMASGAVAFARIGRGATDAATVAIVAGASAVAGAAFVCIRAALLVRWLQATTSIGAIKDSLRSSGGRRLHLFWFPYEPELLSRLLRRRRLTTWALSVDLLGMQQFPQSTFLSVVFMQQLSRFENRQILKATSSDLVRRQAMIPLDLKFVFFTIDAARRSSDQSEESTQIATSLRTISRQIRAHQRQQYYFWRAILRDRYGDMAKYVSKMELLERKIENLYQSLLHAHPESHVIVRHRSVFIGSILGDRELAQREFARAEALEADGGAENRTHMLFDALLAHAEDDDDTSNDVKMLHHQASSSTATSSTAPVRRKSRQITVGFAPGPPTRVTEAYVIPTSLSALPEQEGSDVELTPKRRRSAKAASSHNQTQTSGTAGLKARVQFRSKNAAFGTIRIVSGIALAVLFVGACTTYFLTTSLITRYEATSDIVNQSGGSRNVVHGIARMTRQYEHAAREHDHDQEHAAQEMLTVLNGKIGTFLNDLHDQIFSDEIGYAWNDPHIPFLEPFGSGDVTRHVSLYTALLEYKKSGNLIATGQADVEHLHDHGEEGHEQPREVSVILENGPTTILHGLLDLVNAYAQAAQDDGEALGDTLTVLMIVLAAIVGAFLLLVIAPSYRMLSKERRLTQTVFSALPRAAVANAMEEVSSTSQSSDEADGSILNRHAYDVQTKMLWMVLGCMSVMLTFSFAMGAIALDFSSSATYIGHEVDLAGQRRYLSQRSVFLMQELALNATDTSFGREGSLGDLLVDAVDQLERRNEQLLYGDDELGIPSSLFRNSDLTALYVESDCSTAFDGCKGAVEALGFFVESLLEFRFESADERTTDAHSYQDALRAHNEVIQPMFDQATSLYVEDSRNVVARYQLVLTVLFVLSIPSVILSIALVRFSIDRVERDYQRTMLMLAHVPVAVLESQRIIRAFLWEDRESDSIANMLSEAEEKTKSIIQGAADAVVLLDRHGKIQQLNDAACEMFGWTNKKASGKDGTVLLPDGILPDKKTKGCDDGDNDKGDPTDDGNLAATTTSVKSRTAIARRADGYEFPVSVSVSAGGVGGGLFYAAFIRDVTETMERENELRMLKDRAEAVTMSLFPHEIAKRIMGGASSIAEHHESASALFIDVVNFTALSSHLSAVELMVLLGSVFGVIDKLVFRYGLEKIKMMGDAALICSGLPLDDPEHAQRLCMFALDLLDELDKWNQQTHRALQVRIGIASGPIMAGLVGTTRVGYDVYGDTINTAARLEANGTAGRIHVSQATRDLVEEYFVFESRGEIELKGKGKVQTHFLVGLKDGVELDLTNIARADDAAEMSTMNTGALLAKSNSETINGMLKIVTASSRSGNSRSNSLASVTAMETHRQAPDTPRRGSLLHMAAARSASQAAFDGGSMRSVSQAALDNVVVAAPTTKTIEEHERRSNEDEQDRLDKLKQEGEPSEDHLEIESGPAGDDGSGVGSAGGADSTK